MALMAITQHHGRPGTPTDQAHIESLFGHLKHEWPHPPVVRSSRSRRVAEDREIGQPFDGRAVVGP